jgi:hypothetical protein
MAPIAPETAPLRDPSERAIRRTLLNAGLLPPPIQVPEGLRSKPLDEQTAWTRARSVNRDARDLRLQAFSLHVRSRLGYGHCATVEDILAARDTRDKTAAKLRREIRALDNKRASVNRDSAAGVRAWNTMTRRLTRLRRSLREMSSDSQLARNGGRGGRPPSTADDTYQLIIEIAEMLEMAPSKVLRATFEHVRDAERFIKREMTNLRVWKHRHAGSRRAERTVK